jgi:hypothetical protein
MGGDSVPRELTIEIRGHAGSLEEAAAKFPVIASPIAAMVGFTANVKVGSLEVHLAYECTAGVTERRFLEVFLLALREWQLGGEWLALSHLYIAVEALTEAVLRKARADRGFTTTEELARSLGFNIHGPASSEEQKKSRGRVREQMIFHGDTDTYHTAKKASDGLEHGFMELDEIARHAVKCADKTFHHVRHTIIELLQLPGDVAMELMAITPVTVMRCRRSPLRSNEWRDATMPCLFWESLRTSRERRVGSA